MPSGKVNCGNCVANSPCVSVEQGRLCVSEANFTPLIASPSGKPMYSTPVLWSSFAPVSCSISSQS